MAAQQFLAVGYTWIGDNIHLQVRQLEAESPTQDIKLEGEFHIRKLGEKHCIGWIDFERLEIMPCPDSATTTRTQCQACTEREGFMPCVMCKGFSCPPLKLHVESYCRQPHYLYLACFGDQKVKVGTASEIRKEVRLLEQGPLAAAYVAAASGPVIKQIEHFATGFGYPEAMRREEKRALLTSGLSEETAKALILTAYQDVTERIGSSYMDYFQQPVFISRPALAIAARSFKQLDHLSPQLNEVVGGKIVGAVGNFILLDDGVSTFTLDLTEFKAWHIELNPDMPHSARSKQLSLFDM